MSFDIANFDKSKWLCFQLKDESVYFGEVQYVDQTGGLHDPKQEPDANTKGTVIRHGFGIQLFGTTADNFLCKYEGYWDKDRKNGEGRCWYPDKAYYEGHMKQDLKEGYGKYIWPNGDYYEGNWRNNRFEGGGTFTHHKGNILKGIFKNNYFVRNGDLFINPFLSAEEIEEFIKRRNEINLLREKNKKTKLFFFEKTNDIAQLSDLINKSNKNNRIPLIFSSKQSGQKMTEIFEKLAKTQKRNYYDFDLRHIDTLKRSNQTHREYLQAIKKKLSDVLVKGELFIINLDETNSSYEEIYYPDIREFYSPSCFPQQIWNIEELQKFQVYEKVIAETDNQLKYDISSTFNIAVWSKFKIDETIDPKRIIEKIERRFSSILPMIKIDFILITK